MITAMWYQVFFFLCIVLFIAAIVSIFVWRWKAFLSIAAIILFSAGIYWLPATINQWKFYRIQQEQGWKIIYSNGLSPFELIELRFLRNDMVILSEPDFSFRNPSISKNGSSIVFSMSHNADKENHNIGIAASDGTGLQILHDSGLHTEGISQSPDGRWIAFWSGRNKDTQSMDLYIYDLTQHRVRLLLKKATFYGTYFTPSWSPDSQKIVFASLEGYVSTIDINTSKVKKIVKGDAPAWSPDGTIIVYREGIQFSRKPEERLSYFAISPEGKNRRFIFDGGSTKWDEGDVTQPVVWSPDSKYIMFFKTYDPLFDRNFSKIYIFDIEKNKKYLLKKKRYIQACSWASLGQ